MMIVSRLSRLVNDLECDRWTEVYLQSDERIVVRYVDEDGMHVTARSGSSEATMVVSKVAMLSSPWPRAVMRVAIQAALYEVRRGAEHERLRLRLLQCMGSGSKKSRSRNYGSARKPMRFVSESAR
jgi:hypothetical protein